MGRRIRQRLRDEKGQSFVEFTLILPIALVLILGVVDLGKATSYWLDSSHLANEAARSAAVNGCPHDPSSPPGTCNPTSANYPTKFATAIVNQAETTQLKGKATVCVWDFDSTGAPGTWQKGDEIRITVSSLYDFLPFLNLASRTVTGRSTMRLETSWLTTPASNPYAVDQSGSVNPAICPSPS
jgi:Flp pilus assembly protein TadG